MRQPRVLLNPKVDSLIDQARREVDQNKRKLIYAELQLISPMSSPISISGISTMFSFTINACVICN